MRNLEALFTAIYQPLEWVPRAFDHLQGEAARAMQPFTQLGLTWEEFAGQLKRRFGRNPLLVANLFTHHQEAGEDVSAFIFRKRQEARRLLPHFTDQDLAMVLYNQLRPEVRQHLPPLWTNTGELEERALAVQDALRNNGVYQQQYPQNRRQRAAPAPDRPAAPPRHPTTPRQPAAPRQDDAPPRCRYCPEFHWHRDCPVRSSGNAEGAGALQ